MRDQEFLVKITSQKKLNSVDEGCQDVKPNHFRQTLDRIGDSAEV